MAAKIERIHVMDPTEESGGALSLLRTLYKEQCA